MRAVEVKRIGRRRGRDLLLVEFDSDDTVKGFVMYRINKFGRLVSRLLRSVVVKYKVKRQRK